MTASSFKVKSEDDALLSKDDFSNWFTNTEAPNEEDLEPISFLGPSIENAGILSKGDGIGTEPGI